VASVLALAIIVCAAVGPAAAQTGVGLSAVPVIPDNVTVGQVGVQVDLQLDNASTGSTSLRIDPGDIFLTPSCGTIPLGAVPPCPTPDTGVFSFSATGVGTGDAPGCSGTTFTITPVPGDTTGQVRFTSPAAVELAANGTPGDLCVIRFTVDVLSAPRHDALPGSPGTQTALLGHVSATPVGGGLQASGFGSTATTVARRLPSIATTHSGDVDLGGRVSDTAVVSGRFNPVAGSTVDFRLYGPDDSDCSGTPVFQSLARPLTADGTSVSEPFEPTAPGVYRWRAFYSGDANNAPVSGACNAADENVTVTPPPPPPPPPVTASSTPSGTAVLGGPTGCVDSRFVATVSGRQIAGVVFSLDGRRIATLRSPNRGTRYGVTLNPMKLRRGRHVVVARITFRPASGTRPRSQRFVFQRCARAKSPKFTG